MERFKACADLAVLRCNYGLTSTLDWKDDIALSCPGTREIVSQNLCATLILIPAEHRKQHRRVVHPSLTAAVFCVVGQYFQKLPDPGLLPHFEHHTIYRLIKRSADLE